MKKIISILCVILFSSPCNLFSSMTEKEELLVIVMVKNVEDRVTRLTTYMRDIEDRISKLEKTCSDKQ